MKTCDWCKIKITGNYYDYREFGFPLMILIQCLDCHNNLTWERFNKYKEHNETT